MPEGMTLEQAQAQILELEKQLNERTQERDTLSQNNETLSAQLEEVRTLNQKYFLELRAQYSEQDEDSDEGEEEVLSCEEFAKTLTI